MCMVSVCAGSASLIEDPHEDPTIISHPAAQRPAWTMAGLGLISTCNCDGAELAFLNAAVFGGTPLINEVLWPGELGWERRCASQCIIKRSA